MTMIPIVVVSDGSISPHDRSVLHKVNAFIDRSYRRGLTVTEVLDGAQAMAEGARQGPHDLVGRDAEYYLKCRCEVSKQEHLLTAVPVALGGDFLNLLYNGIKLVLIGAGREDLAQTDKNVPVTPPGGIWWGHKGCMDGLSDDGKALRKPDPARIDTTPSLKVPMGSGPQSA